MNNVCFYASDGSVICEYSNVTSYGHDYVEFYQGKYRTKIYCDTANGEYFAEVTNEEEQEEIL